MGRAFFCSGQVGTQQAPSRTNSCLRNYLCNSHNAGNSAVCRMQTSHSQQYTHFSLATAVESSKNMTIHLIVFHLLHVGRQGQSNLRVCAALEGALFRRALRNRSSCRRALRPPHSCALQPAAGLFATLMHCELTPYALHGLCRTPQPFWHIW